MAAISSTTRAALKAVSSAAAGRTRRIASVSHAKKEGDISNVFVSLSGAAVKPLEPRFQSMKLDLIAGNEEAVRDSFSRLLRVLRDEIEEIHARGSAIIPEIEFSALSDNPPQNFIKSHRDRGVAVVRGVVSEKEAEGWLEITRAYLNANRSTRAFPPGKPAVFELYWSPAQVSARAHPNMLKMQRFLMRQWNTDSNRDALVSRSHPVAYADRLRIRPPGDAGFALGPHIDGGSCERWEPTGYGLGSVYQKIFEGKWEEHDAFDTACRLPVVSDLYNGAGACSMFRMYQGWLSLSHTGPGEGTLLINPLFSRATAYFLLRPLFTPRNPDAKHTNFLSESNWDLETNVVGGMSTALQGAYPGHAQELNDTLHPHLELRKSMVSVPKVRPGDYIAWHCDTIHAVDAKHRGAVDASVLYIPTCPLTEGNARYLARQRDAFIRGNVQWCCASSEQLLTVLLGLPGPDFPGGIGESQHISRPGPEFIACLGEGADDGLRAMGIKAFDMSTVSDKQESRTLARAHEILGL